MVAYDVPAHHSTDREDFALELRTINYLSLPLLID